MNPLSAWLARRKRRRLSQNFVRDYIAAAHRHDARAREVLKEFCATDFPALWADYAAERDKDVESLTIEEKKQAHLDYVLRDQEG